MMTHQPWRSFCLVVSIALGGSACAIGQQEQAATAVLHPAVELRGTSDGSRSSSVHRVLWDPVQRRVIVFSMEHVDFFDSSGVYLGSLGGRGEGPGEFRSTIHVGARHAGFWVDDVRLDRLSFVGTSPPQVQDVQPALRGRLDPRSPVVLAVTMGSLAQGEMVMLGDPQPALTASSSPEWPTIDARAQVAVRVDSSGSNQRLLAVKHRSTDCAGPVQFLDCQQSLMTMSEDARILVVLEPGGHEGTNRLLQLTRIDLSGDTIQSVRLKVPSASFSAVEIDSLRAALVARGNGRERVEESPFPALTLAASWMVVGADGAIWLAGRREAVGRQWTLLDSLSRIVGRFHLDEEIYLGGVTHTSAWGGRDLPDGRVELVRIELKR